jgi:hypothetical protein
MHVFALMHCKVALCFAGVYKKSKHAISFGPCMYSNKKRVNKHILIICTEIVYLHLSLSILTC